MSKSYKDKKGYKHMARKGKGEMPKHNGKGHGKSCGYKHKNGKDSD
jgi:hypothetical protein